MKKNVCIPLIIILKARISIATMCLCNSSVLEVFVIIQRSLKVITVEEMCVCSVCVCVCLCVCAHSKTQ